MAAIGQPIRAGQPTPAIAQPASSSVWQEASENGQSYYHNTETGTVQWERPSDVEMARRLPTAAAASVVMGIPIDDPALVPIIKRVMYLSGLCALLIVADGVLNLASSGDAWFLLVGFCTLVIPACGYCGALKKSRDFMCCFCGWSFACFLLMFINLVVVITLTIKGELPNNDSAPTVVVVFSIIIFAASSVAYFVSFVYGNKLHQHPYFEAPEVTQHMVSMQALSLPAQQHVQQHQPPPMVSATVCVAQPQQPAASTDAGLPVMGRPLGRQDPAPDATAKAT